LSLIGKAALLFVGGSIVYGVVTGQLSTTGGTTAPVTPAAVAAPKLKPKSKPAAIPHLDLYKRYAGTCEHLDWALLAAVGWAESSHGQFHPAWSGVLTGENTHTGAKEQGPMQFTPGTWEAARKAAPGDRRGSA
jgi:hypothetical protein